MEKETKGSVRYCSEAPSGGLGSFAACAAMALLESFAFSFYLPSLREGDLGLAQILYLGVREDGLLLLLLAVVFFCGWALARRLIVSLSVRDNKAGAILAGLFALFIVVGRAFSVDDIGVGSYGTFETIVSSRSRILLAFAMFVGLAMLFYNILGLLFYALDVARSTLATLRLSVPDLVKEGGCCLFANVLWPSAGIPHEGHRVAIHVGSRCVLVAVYSGVLPGMCLR